LAKALTRLRFKSLPAVEQAAIVGAIAAVNAVTPYKRPAVTTAADIDHVAFRAIADQHAPGNTNFLRESIIANARHKGWSEERIASPEGAAVVQQSYDINFVDAVRQMGEVLADLITDKRLLGRAGQKFAAGGGSFASLAATVNSDVQFLPGRVVLNAKGFAEFTPQIKFGTALGLIAWAIIRLSELRSHGHVVLRCRECNHFKIVSVSKQQHFCSPAHRNLYYVHAHRERQRSEKARKHK
jgi:hypothetical protein